MRHQGAWPIDPLSWARACSRFRSSLRQNPRLGPRRPHLPLRRLRRLCWSVWALDRSSRRLHRDDFAWTRVSWWPPCPSLCALDAQLRVHEYWRCWRRRRWPEWSPSAAIGFHTFHACTHRRCLLDAWHTWRTCVVWTSYFGCDEVRPIAA